MMTNPCDGKGFFYGLMDLENQRIYLLKLIDRALYIIIFNICIKFCE